MAPCLDSMFLSTSVIIIPILKFHLVGADEWQRFVQLVLFFVFLNESLKRKVLNESKEELPNSYTPSLWVYKDFYDIMKVEDSPTAVLQCSVK